MKNNLLPQPPHLLFRDRVRGYVRNIGKTQDILALDLGMGSSTLSKKFNLLDNCRFDKYEVKSIVLVLARWGAISNRSEAIELLELMGCPPASAFSVAEWQQQPLAALTTTVSDANDNYLVGAETAHSHNYKNQKYNLPVMANLTSFIGRDDGVAIVTSMLCDTNNRLVTLTGPGGVGKTRFALELAKRLTLTGSPQFADGICFVDLSSINDGNLLMSVVAQALGIKESVGIGLSLEQKLKTYLQQKRLLLVLDNFEQIVDVAALSLLPLLADIPYLKLLITSRMSLNLLGEQQYEIAPLAQDDAIDLFIARAKAISTYTVQPNDLPIISEICMRLDGLPLALEIVAAYIKLLPLQSILNQLGDDNSKLSLVAEGPRNLPDRQKSLYRAVDWSYNLLSVGEQQLFTQLAAFGDNYTLQAIAAVVGAGQPHSQPNPSDDDLILMGTLKSLVDKSLLVIYATTAAGSGGSEPRFTMLKSIRDYAYLKLSAKPDEFDTVCSKHLRYYGQLAANAEPLLHSVNQVLGFRLLTSDYGNMRTALAWSLRQPFSGDNLKQGIDLAFILFQLWHVKGRLVEGCSWIDQFLASPIEVTDKAKMLYARGVLTFLQADGARAARLLGEAIALFRVTNNKILLARALSVLGVIVQYAQGLTAAKPFYDESLAIYDDDDVDDKYGLGLSLSLMGTVAYNQADFDRAIEVNTRAIDCFGIIGEQWALTLATGVIAVVAYKRGDLTTAKKVLLNGLPTLQDMGDTERQVVSLYHLGVIAMQENDMALAHSYYAQIKALDSANISVFMSYTGDQSYDDFFRKFEMEKENTGKGA